jgi:hypothetical protein
VYVYDGLKKNPKGPGERKTKIGVKGQIAGRRRLLAANNGETLGETEGRRKKG